MSAIPLNEISSQPVQRLSTGYHELDYIYGSNRQINGRWAWGLPRAKLSLWSGAAGCGKSRLGVAISAQMSRMGYRVLYIQAEVDPAEFRTWFPGDSDPSRIFLSDATALDDHLQAMWQVCPSLVIVDSVSMLEEMPHQVRQVVMAYREAAEAAGAHVILLSHMNAKGKPKGGTDLPHLVDVTARLERDDALQWLFIGTTKNRYGPVPRQASFYHDANGLKPMCLLSEGIGLHQIALDPTTGQERRINATENVEPGYRRISPPKPRRRRRGLFRWPVSM
jgi:predicted ATP-dependent serine protease